MQPLWLAAPHRGLSAVCGSTNEIKPLTPSWRPCRGGTSSRVNSAPIFILAETVGEKPEPPLPTLRPSLISQNRHERQDKHFRRGKKKEPISHLRLLVFFLFVEVLKDGFEAHQTASTENTAQMLFYERGGCRHRGTGVRKRRMRKRSGRGKGVFVQMPVRNECEKVKACAVACVCLGYCSIPPTQFDLSFL